MMKNEFVPYEEALVLKELGFNELCLAYYQKSSVIGDDTILPLIIRNEATNWNDNSFSKLGVPFYSAPLYQQAFRWFREKYKLNGEVNYLPNIEKYGIISSNMTDKPKNLSEFKNYRRGAEVTNNYAKYDTYEEAELACIKELIEIVKE